LFLLTCISYKYDDDIVDDDGDFNDEDHDVNDFIDDNDIKMALMMIIMVM